MPHNEIMEKHGIAEIRLENFFKRLLDAGLITQGELGPRNRDKSGAQDQALRPDRYLPVSLGALLSSRLQKLWFVPEILIFLSLILMPLSAWSLHRILPPERDSGASPMKHAASSGATATQRATPVQAKGIAKDFQSALEVAKVDTVRNFLQEGRDVNAVTTDGYTTLMLVSGTHLTFTKMGFELAGGSKNDEERARIAEMLIKSGVDVNKGDSDGITPLILAAVGGHEKLTRMLLDHGAKANGGDRRRNTALMWVAGNGHSPDVVRLLIERGADVHHRNEDGETALKLAREVQSIILGKEDEARKKEVVEILEKHQKPLKEGAVSLEQDAARKAERAVGKSLDVLFWMALGGADVDAVKDCIKKGEDLSAVTSGGETPLLVATGVSISYYSAQWVRFLHFE